MVNGNLLQLLHLCDPALPVGGFSHSAGLETYVHNGKVHDKETAREFVVQQLSQNLLYTDAAFVSLAFDSAAANDIAAIIRHDEMCTAVKLPQEMRLASNKLGIRLLKIFQQNCSFELAQLYQLNIYQKKALGHYCIAFGLLAQSMGMLKKDALTGFLYNAASGFVTNSVKLVPLGQQHGQEIMMSVFPLINQLAEIALTPNESMIGFCNAGFDVGSMQHEQLYTRLYMS